MERRSMTKDVATRRSAEAWRRIVAELDRSGATVAAFAAVRGLNANTVAWWRYALRRKDARATQSAPTATAVGPRFVELWARPSSPPLLGTIEVGTPAGLAIRASADVDPESFSRVVAALLRTC